MSIIKNKSMSKNIIIGGVYRPKKELFKAPIELFRDTPMRVLFYDENQLWYDVKDDIDNVWFKGSVSGNTSYYQMSTEFFKEYGIFEREESFSEEERIRYVVDAIPQIHFDFNFYNKLEKLTTYNDFLEGMNKNQIDVNKVALPNYTKIYIYPLSIKNSMKNKVLIESNNLDGFLFTELLWHAIVLQSESARIDITKYGKVKFKLKRFGSCKGIPTYCFSAPNLIDA
jgi:hypothetical protein